MAKKKPSTKASGVDQPTMDHPEQDDLPGTEELHHPVLGPLAKRVAQIRRSRSRGKAEEDELLDNIITEMRRSKMHQFIDHGVEFVPVQGKMRLRVRLVQRKAAAVDEDE